MQTQTHFKISNEALAQGLSSAVWPARLQRMKSPSSLSPDWELWLDGGHNDSAAEALATQIRTWSTQDNKPLYIVIGMMGHKDAAAFARPLAGLAAGIVVIPVGDADNSFPVDGLAAIWRQEGARDIQAISAPWPAPLQALQNRPGPGRILVTGSLYLAGLLS
jgi:dihydrofolate synthase/folylpolyglutamate synthase